jgi:hypothetical protein
MRRVLVILAALSVLSAQSVTPSAPLVKTPFETFPVSLDFSPVTGSDSLSIYAVVATNNSQPAPTVIAASPPPAIIGTQAVFWVQNGAIGQPYLLGVQVVDTTTGAHYEGDIQMVVKTSR